MSNATRRRKRPIFRFSLNKFPMGYIRQAIRASAGRVLIASFLVLTFLAYGPLARHEVTAGTPITTVNFAEFKNPLSSVSHIAYVQGFTAQRGINLHPISVESGPDVIASLKSSSNTAAQTGNLAVEPIAAMIAAGSDPVVLATAITSSDHVKIVTFQSTGITSDPTTLKGKRIGVVLDTIGETYLDRLLKLGGLERSEVILINSRPSEIRAALIRGDIDAGVLWDPFMQQAVRLYQQGVKSGTVVNRGQPVVLVNSKIFTTYLNIVTTRKYLTPSRPALVALLRSMIDAETFISSNQFGASTMIEDWLGLERGDLREFFGTAKFEVRLDTPALKGELLGVLQHLAANDKTTTVPSNLAPFVDTSLLEEINPKLVNE